MGQAVCFGLAFASLSAWAETPIGLVKVSSETGGAFYLNGTVCYEPGRPMAVALLMRRNFREQMYFGPYASTAVWKLQMNRNQIYWNQALPRNGETVVRPDGRTYHLRGTYFQAAGRVTVGTVHLTLPVAARGEVVLTAQTASGEDVASVTFISSATEGANCTSEMAESFYRPVPGEPGFPFPLIGGGSFSDVPSFPPESLPVDPAEVQTPPRWMCTVLPHLRGCSNPNGGGRDQNVAPPSLGPSEGGVGIG